MKLHSYDVRGRGTFPTDMLRYDCCWPCTEAGALYIIVSVHYPEESLIRIVSYKPPTIARWKSFGWTVLKCE